MKFIVRLLQVFVCVVLFLLAGYIIEERDQLFSYNEEIDTNEILSSHDEQVEKKSNEMTTHNEDEKEVHLPTDSVKQDNKTDVVEEKKVMPKEDFTYDMDPIDPHTVGHIYDMLEIIEQFRTTPHNDQDLLIKQLNTKNFIHFEDELEDKNIALYEVLKNLMNSIEKHEDFSDSESIMIILDDIYLILDNITKIE